MKQESIGGEIRDSMGTQSDTTRKLMLTVKLLTTEMMTQTVKIAVQYAKTPDRSMVEPIGILLRKKSICLRSHPSLTQNVELKKTMMFVAHLVFINQFNARTMKTRKMHNYLLTF